jgi:hypothetical protein
MLSRTGKLKIAQRSQSKNGKYQACNVSLPLTVIPFKQRPGAIKILKPIGRKTNQSRKNDNSYYPQNT